ncbi:coat Protein [Rosellinia necatrix partitivirus 7]|nr:coat Protein [Rosellinia necatrix partitivirus 7]
MSFFSKLAKGTTSRFSRRRPTATLLPIPEEPVTPGRDEPRKADAHDDKAKADQPLDDTLVPPEKPTREKMKKPDNKAQEGQSSTEPHTTSDFVGTENIYQLTWRSEANYRMIAEHHPQTNYYVPSAIPLFSLLEAAEDRINASKHIQQHEPNYNPYAVKVYYAYMYYMQIFRAKRESGHIEGSELKILKRFEQKFPLNSLPCAEIVYGYFSSLHATELAESKYDWIVPRIALTNLQLNPRTKRFTAFDLNAINHDNGATHLQPIIPVMMGILNTFVHTTAADMPTYIDETDTFVPTILDTPANHHATNIFDSALASNTNVNNSVKLSLRSVGANSPFRFGNNNYGQAARYAKRTDFGRSVDVICRTDDTDNRANLARNPNFTSLAEYLLMPETTDLNFFDYLREMAVIHARFFDQVFHFHDVQTTGGLEPAVICQLKRGRREAARHYDDATVANGNNILWYETPFRTLQAGFATNRAGLKRNEELQAFAYGINSLLPITGMDLLNTHGTFWENREWIQTLFLDTPDNSNVPTVANLTNTGKPMFPDHKSIVLRCFREKPHGTGVVDNDYE